MYCQCTVHRDVGLTNGASFEALAEGGIVWK